MCEDGRTKRTIYNDNPTRTRTPKPNPGDDDRIVGRHHRNKTSQIEQHSHLPTPSTTTLTPVFIMGCLILAVVVNLANNNGGRVSSSSSTLSPLYHYHLGIGTCKSLIQIHPTNHVHKRADDRTCVALNCGEN